MYGLNHTTKIGIPALMANVPKPSDEADLAATSIGQASVLFSPLGMATVASAIGRGRSRLPQLVVGAGDASVKPTNDSGQRRCRTSGQMMLSGRGERDRGGHRPAGRHARQETGTAQYRTGSRFQNRRLRSSAVRYRVRDRYLQNTGGQDGGPVDGQLIAKFLNALGPGA